MSIDAETVRRMVEANRRLSAPVIVQAGETLYEARQRQHYGAEEGLTDLEVRKRRLQRHTAR